MARAAALPIACLLLTLLVGESASSAQSVLLWVPPASIVCQPARVILSVSDAGQLGTFPVVARSFESKQPVSKIVTSRAWAGPAWVPVSAAGWPVPSFRGHCLMMTACYEGYIHSGLASSIKNSHWHRTRFGVPMRVLACMSCWLSELAQGLLVSYIAMKSKPIWQ